MKRVAASIIVALLTVGPLAGVAAGGNSWSGNSWSSVVDGKRMH